MKKSSPASCRRFANLTKRYYTKLKLDFLAAPAELRMGQIAHLLIFPIPNGLSMEGTENEILKEDNNVLSIFAF